MSAVTWLLQVSLRFDCVYIIALLRPTFENSLPPYSTSNGPNSNGPNLRFLLQTSQLESWDSFPTTDRRRSWRFLPRTALHYSDQNTYRGLSTSNFVWRLRSYFPTMVPPCLSCLSVWPMSFREKGRGTESPRENTGTDHLGSLLRSTVSFSHHTSQGRGRRFRLTSLHPNLKGSVVVVRGETCRCSVLIGNMSLRGRRVVSTIERLTRAPGRDPLSFKSEEINPTSYKPTVSL